MDATKIVNTPFFIGSWKVLPRQNRLVKDGEVHTVEPKVMQVLICLAKDAPEPVSRINLFEEVWEGNYVSEDVLSRSISILRALFGDNPKHPSYIETIPKYGYALLISPAFEEPHQNGISSQATEHQKYSRFPVYMSIIIAALLVFAFGINFLKDPEPPDQHTEIIPVTSLSGRELSPNVSPGGERVVFLAASDEEPATDIYVTELGRTSNPARLTENSAFELSPVWSPDGERVAFIRYFKDGACGIYIINRWGNEEQHVTECNKEFYTQLDWSSDREWLAYTYNEPETHFTVPAIYLHSLKTGKRQRLTNPSEGIFGDYKPRFSSDGSSLIFLRSIKEGIGTLISVNLETGMEDTLFQDNQIRIRGYDWYDEQQTLVLSANRHGGYGLWEYDLPSQRFSTLIPGSYLFSPTVVQKEPSLQILYEEWKLETNIYSLNLNPSQKQQEQSLITSSRMDFQPSLSMANGKIAFLSDRTGKYELWIADQDGSNLRNFQTDIKLMPHTPMWSPSGEQLVFTGLIEGTSQIFIADLFSNHVQQFTSNNADHINPVWSADGNHIYFSEHKAGQWNIIRKTLEGEKETPVVEGKDIFFAQESTDGKTLYYITNNTNELYAYTLNSDTEPQKISGVNIDPDHRQDWRVTNNGLYYFGLQDRASTLHRYIFNTGEIEQIYTFHKKRPGPGLTVNEEEKQIYFVKVDRSSSDLVMLEKETDS